MGFPDRSSYSRQVPGPCRLICLFLRTHKIQLGKEYSGSPRTSISCGMRVRWPRYGERQAKMQRVSVSTVTVWPKIRGIFGFGKTSPQDADMEYQGNELHSTGVLRPRLVCVHPKLRVAETSASE